MDATKLLEREAEYRKLNKELEKRSMSLMREIEISMQKPDIFSDFTSLTCRSKTPKKSNTDEYHKATQNYIREESPQPTMEVVNIIVEHNFLNNFIRSQVSETVLPNTFLKDIERNSVNVESLLKFLASKVKILQSQLEKQQNDIDKKVSQYEDYMRSNVEYETEIIKLKSQLNNYHDKYSRQTGWYKTLQEKYKAKECELSDLRHEYDNACTNMKRVTLKLTSSDKKCASLQTELDKAKIKLEHIAEQEMEYRNQHHKQLKTLKSKLQACEQTNKRVSEERDNHARLIVNLKQQNKILGAIKLVDVYTKEFCDILEFKIK